MQLLGLNPSQFKHVEKHCMQFPELLKKRSGHYPRHCRTKKNEK
jgi:hypothetical protein